MARTKILFNLVKNLHLEENIQFVGRVSEEEKVRLYQRAWLFMNPSFMEGWGITSIEANACAQRLSLKRTWST